MGQNKKEYSRSTKKLDTLEGAQRLRLQFYSKRKLNILYQKMPKHRWIRKKVIEQFWDLNFCQKTI